MASSRKSRPSKPLPGKELPARVAAVISEHVRRGDRLVAGLSGGVDSMVLVDVLHRLARKAGFELAALHVNHQINPAAGRWAAFCRAYCKQHDVPLKVIKVNLPPGASLEAAARTARYAALAKARADFIVLAHTLDDQAETVLLQLLRGAGVKGASAMPVLRPTPRASRPAPAILRPLIDIPRREIEAYARARKLAWIEDDSNADIAFDRNFMRHRVLPVVAERFPAYRTTLLRASRNFAEAAHLLDELARVDAPFSASGISVAALRRLSVPRAKNVVRSYLAAAGVTMPNATRLAECVRPVRQPRAVGIVVARGGHDLRRYGDELRLVDKALAPGRGFSRAWEGESRLCIPELGGTLVMTRHRGAGISLAKVTAAAVTVRVRQGGERVRVHAQRPRRSLKNLLQEARVPPWLRERLPLLFCGEALVYVPGIGIDIAFRARREEGGIEPRWDADCGPAAM